MTLQELIDILKERQMKADHTNPDCCKCDCSGCDFVKLENQWPDGSADYVPCCHWLNQACLDYLLKLQAMHMKGCDLKLRHRLIVDHKIKLSPENCTDPNIYLNPANLEIKEG